MRAPFALSLAWRESRSSIARMAAYMIAITIGVAALVAINSFRANLVRSIDAEARGLLGADLRLNSNTAMPDTVRAIVDSLENAVPGSTAGVTSTMSIALSQRGAGMVQLRGITGPYPLYGSMATDPPSLWGTLEGDHILVEPSLLSQLDAVVGDTLRIGGLRFVIAGVVTSLPQEVSFRNALGPRVFMDAAALDSTGLMQIGSIARHEVYVRMEDARVLERFVDTHHDLFRRSMIGFTTAAEQAEQLANVLDALGRFLGLVGLAALLLGGLGVASAIDVFIRSRRDTIAVLRCIGATQRTAFTAYLLQAVGLGIIGAGGGVLAGVALQAGLPALLRNVVPFDVSFSIEWPVLLAGLLVGTGVTIVFALLPLLEIRGITPLRALRVSVEPASTRDPLRWLVHVLVPAVIAAISIWQAGRTVVGLAYAVALAFAGLILWLCATAVTRLTQRFFPRRARFPVRQGVANLFRPQNQTVAVTMAVGFGVFMLSALWVVQRNLLDWISLDAETGGRPNVVLIDIQSDQVESTRDTIARYSTKPAELTPIVPGKIVAVNGISATDLVSKRQTPRVEPWAVRREYRHTYRAEPTATEKIIAGSWWKGPVQPGAVAQISVEEDLLESLGAKLGDHITWDIQGVQIETVVTSVREVDWAQFETNFFVVFQPGVLESAPQTFVALVQADSSAVVPLQRAVAGAHSNISAIDVGGVQRTLERIVGRVAFAIRFMALFSMVAGALVLLAALAAGRFQRVRESALLRVLGARRAQVRGMLLTEYAALGLLAGLTGVVLGGTAGWLIVRYVFKLDFNLPFASLGGLAAGVVLMAALMGVYTSRNALAGTPLELLRDTTA